MNRDQGIDYGMGSVNVDKSNGIRFGLIGVHSLDQEFLGEFEADYGDVPDDQDELYFEGEPNGFYLKTDEMLAHMGSDGFGVWCERSPYYTYAKFCSPCAPGAGDLDNPLIVNAVSPMFCGWGELCTHTPLAENGEESCIHNQGFAKVYAFGHECFESNIAPYRVFRVSDNSEVVSSK